MNEFKELSQAVADVKKDTGNIKGDIKSINGHLKNLNSRTGNVEKRVENLEDEEYREVRCVQRDVISEIKNSMLTVDKFEVWAKKKEEKRREERGNLMHKELIAVKKLETHQRKMQWVIAAIVGVGMVVVSLITWLL